MPHERAPGHRRLYALARALCALIGLSVLVLDVASIPAAYTLLQTPCLSCDSNAIQISVDQMRALKASGLSLQAYSLYMVSLIAFTQFSFAGLGALLFIRRSDDRMALFASLMLVTFGGAAFTGTLHALPAVNGLFQSPVYLLNAIGQIAFLTFFYLFPNGRFVPRWTIAPAVVGGLGWLIPLFGDPTLTAFASIVTDGWLFAILVLSVVVAQVYRYWRVSSPRERQQTKWVVYGIALCLIGFLVIIIADNALLPPRVVNDPIATLASNALTYLFFLLIPASITAAVLRSRLYDVDALINRTLVYGALTAILGALYLGLIIGAQALLRRVTGQQTQPAAVIVLSTLLIATLFQPLRHRIQATIDRRFYRHKYDAARTLAAFGATLRSKVELDELRASLVAVAQETMQPARVSLWLRPSHSEETEKTRRVTTP
ncbi:MAG TPA: hypothetical protein VFQ25_10480 [Ktedonobacterales bacterium]|nr:hypothetical protein [Ktedonobacterales bacterium]